jgi:hypothetical protein
MRTAPIALAVLTFATLAADTQKTPPSAAVTENRAAKQKDISLLLSVLGWPKANSDAARKQLEGAAKDPKIHAFPAAYWKDYSDAAGPEAFEKLLAPIFDKAYTHAEVKALLNLFASPEFKQLMDKQPEGLKLFVDKNPSLLKAKAFQAYSAHMTEVGKKLREKHGVKLEEPKK